MSEKVTVKVAGGCPVCENPAVKVPEDYTPDTIIKCQQCGHHARWKDFFKSGPSG